MTWWLLGLLGLAACDTREREEDCIGRYGPEYGYGGVDVASVQQACELGGGTGCGADRYISAEAARCIAEGHDGANPDVLPAGNAPWVLWLAFDSDWRRPVWTVAATLASDSGEIWTLDAASGEILARELW